jgi:hypothetical protein
MKQKDGIFRQRVGYLIEQDICKKFNLFYNKRQRTQGYYDAYDEKTIFEIKASSITNNTFIIRFNNHQQLTSADGIYIFVSYKLKNKDKDLSVISDIKITDIKFIKARDIDISKKKLFKSKRSDLGKKSIRIYLSDIKSLGCIDYEL